MYTHKTFFFKPSKNMIFVYESFTLIFVSGWLILPYFSGYFTHVTTLGEVKEQVLKYVPVMARPMVMYRDKHPIVWTGVYADIEVSLSSYFALTAIILKLQNRE